MYVVREGLGNPYYLIESLRHYLETGSSDVGTPGVVVARIKAQNIVEQSFLEILAVSGDAIRLKAIEKITGHAVGDLCSAVESLWSRGLLRIDRSQDDPEVRLAHDALGIAILDVLSPERKKGIHASIAELAEASCGGLPSQWEAVTLVRHWLHSDMPERAIPYLGLAIDTLVAHDLLEAAAHIRLQALRRSVTSDWKSFRETLHLLYECGELDTIQELVSQELASRSTRSLRRERWLHRFLGRAAIVRWRWEQAAASLTKALEKRNRSICG